ncbi:MAG: hypothetical protein AAGG51_26255 [Cyanobacteria bacterium P01_G01_bin.54]
MRVYPTDEQLIQQKIAKESSNSTHEEISVALWLLDGQKEYDCLEIETLAEEIVIATERVTRKRRRQ